MSEKTVKRIRKAAKQELSAHVIGAHNINEVLARITRRHVEPELIIIDLFCGAGGTTTGFARLSKALVAACVNHDYMAIKSHWLNHPEVAHFEEDMRILDLVPLKKLVKFYRELYPNAKIVVWASLECTNFSKAKGGMPRDADSRTLADHLHRYIQALDPDYIMIENVVEFMSWGPLDEKGKPVSRKNGADWLRWRREVNDHGYRDEWRELNSADFGAYTSRNRLFGIFAKEHLPIVWPEPTHAKKVKAGMFGSLKPWKAVREVLELSDTGPSYFIEGRIKSEATDWRVLGGLKKFCTSPFISTYYGGNLEHKTYSIENPARVITTQRNQMLVSTFLLKYFTGEGMCQSIEQPGPTIRCKDGTALMNTRSFIMKYHGNGHNCHSIDTAHPTLDTGDRCAPITALQFINEQYGNSIGHALERSTGSVLANPKQNLVSAWLVNPQFHNEGNSIEKPSPVIIAKQDKRPLALAQAITELLDGEMLPDFIKVTDEGILYEVYESDSEPRRLIKEFMAQNLILDVRMRMLKILELLRIQDMGEVKLIGSQSEQKKFIGNAVVPLIPENWGAAIINKLEQRVMWQHSKKTSGVLNIIMASSSVKHTEW